MKTTIIQSIDSNGNPIFEYIHEADNNKKNNRNDKVFDELLNGMAETNAVQKTLIDEFWNLNPQQFENTFHQLVQKKIEIDQKYFKSNKEITDNDISDKSSKSLKEGFIKSFVSSLYGENDKKLLKNNLDKVLDSFSTVFNNQLLPLLLWQLDFKEQSLKLLENCSCSFTIEQYDYIYDKFSKDFRRNDLPISVVEKDNILNEEKLEFIQIQKNYCTFNKLNNSLSTKKSNKPSKI